MATSWTLSISGISASLATWGISGLQRRRRSQAVDVVGFDVVADVDEPGPFAWGDIVTISRDGVPWFVGKITGITRAASGQAESLAYEVSGPWWYLEQLVYQQVWTVYGTGQQVKKSHALINTWADGSSMGVRSQLNEALEWARSRAEAAYGGSPFQWDPATFPDAQIPADEVRDVTVAEVLKKQLRWIPDAVTWFDYATTPPTLRIARRSLLEEKSIAVPGAAVSSVQIVPRNDLVVPSVVLKYERTDTVDGTSVPTLGVDIAPSGATGEEFGALCATIDLQGFSASYATAYIGTIPFPSTTEAWWEWLKIREAHLRQAEFALEEVLAVARIVTDNEGAAVMPRMLVEGQIPDWMGKTAQTETVRIKARIRVTVGADVVEIVTREFSVNVTGTNAETGTYTQLTSATAGEYSPIGLAQILYDALSVLDYDGAVTITAEEVHAEAAAVSVGHRLSITGLKAEWATMAAMVQDVTEDVDNGTTSIRFGPPQHLGGRDLVELLRVNRFRLVYTAPSVRAGNAVGGGSIGLGRTTPKENSSSGSGERQRLLLRVGAGAIELDAAMAGNLVVTLKEVSICVDGAEKKMLLLCSDPY